MPLLKVEDNPWLGWTIGGLLVLAVLALLVYGIVADFDNFAEAATMP